MQAGLFLWKSLKKKHKKTTHSNEIYINFFTGLAGLLNC